MTYAERLMYTLTHALGDAIAEQDADEITTLVLEARSLGIPVWVSATVIPA